MSNFRAKLSYTHECVCFYEAHTNVLMQSSYKH